ncbi:hypothetical protein ACOKFD_15810 [Flagellimonas sp. S174]|uniref:hypothetical protein n=1 Tax=Flagellimonas sp. S174 TaxID=3410790 RepID=UPI003BF4C36C
MEDNSKDKDSGMANGYKKHQKLSEKELAIENLLFQKQILKSVKQSNSNLNKIVWILVVSVVVSILSTLYIIGVNLDVTIRP